MELHPFVVQSAFSVPLTFGLVLYTLLRKDRTRLHYVLAGLLGSVCLWLLSATAGIIASDPRIRSAALDLQFLTIAFMAPYFLVAMGRMARLPLFERSRAATVGVFSISSVFLLAYLTNDLHQLFLTDRELAMAAAPPREWAGPLYWAQQLWCEVFSVLAMSIVVGAVVRGRTLDERRRARTILGAVLVPVLAHFAYLTGWQPVDFSLAPAALGITGVFFVQAIHTYGLFESQPILRHDVLEHIQDGLLLADPRGIVLDANAAAEALLGSGRDELRGHTIVEVIERLRFEGATALGERIAALALGGDGLAGEVETEDGRVVEIAAGAVEAHGSMPAGRFVTVRDRSAQRRTERLLRERQRLESVGILAAGVAHEVNNPLAYVRANLVHLQELVAGMDKPLDSTARDGRDLLEIPEVVAESLDGLERIRRVVDSMLRFSRIPDEEMRLVDLNEVVGQALRLAELQRNVGVSVEQMLTPELPLVLGSADRLVQVLLNLFLNAKQALAEGGGRVVAETAVAGDRVVVRVRDDGPGVPEADRERIFDPFYTTRAPGDGTGLGLSIAFDILREHRGTIELERTPEGASFVMSLPSEQAFRS